MMILIYEHINQVIKLKINVIIMKLVMNLVWTIFVL